LRRILFVHIYSELTCAVSSVFQLLARIILIASRRAIARSAITAATIATAAA
jgi:hypothetical protein